jgi:ubiquinone/menaquinone biosynthesis C-methylase UbiE
MLEKARKNLKKTGFTNVEFVKGDIEAMPLPENTYDVVISNCVLNLVPDKEKAFSEIFRVLKPGGHFCISDVVLDGNLPEGLIKEAELYAGCVSGAVQRRQYLSIIEEKGFSGITVEKNKAITIPDEILSNYLSGQEMKEYKTSGTGIFSITVIANK